MQMLAEIQRSWKYNAVYQKRINHAQHSTLDVRYKTRWW